MSRDAGLLFSKYDLRAVIDGQEQAMYKEIDEIETSRLLNTGTEDWCDYLETKYRLEPLALDETSIQVDQSDAKLDVSGDPRRFIFDRSQPFYIPGTEVSFYVTFTGEKDLLRCRPSSWKTMFPHAAVQEGMLVFTYATAEHNAEEVKRQFERDLGLTRDFVGFVKNDVDPFNDRVRGLAKSRIEARKAKLLKDQGMVASLGYPLRRREGTPTSYVVPVVRKKLVEAPTVKPGTPPYVSEPELESARYEEILGTLHNMILAMERSPSTFSRLSEEELRDFLLVQLNAIYEGRATGETFNFEGKTDILIRENDKNIFIAECKFWGGPAKLSDTIDQLLGYTCWRDTKTAILVFNRDTNLTTVLDKIPDTVKAHPNCKRPVDYRNETGFRFVFGHRDDPNRELILTVLVFEVPA